MWSTIRMVVFKKGRGDSDPNSLSHAGRNVVSGGAGTGWKCGARTGNANGSTPAADRRTFAGRSRTEYGGAVRTAAADGAHRRLRRTAEEGGGRVCAASGTQSGA